MPEPPLTHLPTAPKQQAILVVDDVQSVRFYHTHILKKAGYRCEVAHDGLDALQKLQTEAFDLVVIDIVMPNLNGLELIEKIRSSPSLAKLPVLVISSEPVGDKFRLERSVTAGPVGYAKKPLFPATVLKEIDRLLAGN